MEKTFGRVVADNWKIDRCGIHNIASRWIIVDKRIGLCGGTFIEDTFLFAPIPLPVAFLESRGIGDAQLQIEKFVEKKLGILIEHRSERPMPYTQIVACPHGVQTPLHLQLLPFGILEFDDVNPRLIAIHPLRHRSISRLAENLDAAMGFQSRKEMTHHPVAMDHIP